MLTFIYAFLVAEAMTLAPNVGSDRSWVYNTLADVSEGEARPELLAIRFASSERKTELIYSPVLSLLPPSLYSF